MSELAFKKKVTRKAFETRLVRDFGHENLSKSPYDESGWDNENDVPTTTRLTLYYIEGVHVGTWCKGIGWIFSHAYNDLKAQIAQMAALDEILKDKEHA
jgi:hypothetical protein